MEINLYPRLIKYQEAQRARTERIVAKIESLAEEGHSILEISGRLDLPYGNVRYYARKKGLTLKAYHCNNNNEEIALFAIDAPYNGMTSLQKIGDHFNLTRERIRQILEEKGIDQDFKELKKDAKRKLKEERSKILYLLSEHASKRSESRKDL
ncbi:MAG: hypothetical protein AABX03_02380 [Nanoarchaeota archaeon]